MSTLYVALTRKPHAHLASDWEGVQTEWIFSSCLCGKLSNVVSLSILTSYEEACLEKSVHTPEVPQEGRVRSDPGKAVSGKANAPCPAGIPRSYVEAQEDYLRREAKLLKREGTPPPPPPPRDLTETYKTRPLDPLGPLKLKPTHEGVVATVKEAGRSIHEIPREELRRTPELPLAPRPLKEGSITQVGGAEAWASLRGF